MTTSTHNQDADSSESQKNRAQKKKKEPLAQVILKDYQSLIEGLEGYERRKSQEMMVAQIAKGLEAEKSVIVEAGTGSGKSFGYLIPLLLSDVRPIVITTATIALQEQLINKDIPFLLEAMGLSDLKVKLVKGRGNYLCIQKMQELERNLTPRSRHMLNLQYLKGSLQDDWDGDRAVLDMSVPNDFWNEVRSETDDCLGNKCVYFKENPYRMSREDLDKADIIVANHALYLQDVVSGGTLLPKHELVVFDEAHQIKSYASNAFTARIGKYASTRLIQKISRRLQPVPDDVVSGLADSESRLMAWLFRSRQEVFRLYPDDEFYDLIDAQIEILTDLRTWLGGMDIQQLSLEVSHIENEQDIDKAATQKAKLLEQLNGLITRWQFFAKCPLEDFTDNMGEGLERVNWAEINKDRIFFEIKSTPLDVADILTQYCWKEKTAILTSATLSIGDSLRFFQRDVGMENAEQSILPSPFKYAEQSALYLPQGMPEPNDETFAAAVANETIKILRKSNGRALVLFTSNNNMHLVSQSVIPQVLYPCKVQGDMPRSRLIDWFKETENSVIFATATFWEGIDIPGESLSCVIIDKLPFAPPNEPVTQAVVDHMKRKGENWFGDFSLPNAIMRLKQGFGRLIRTRMDKGLVAILDNRVMTKGYGRTVLKSLPKVPIYYDLDAVPDALFEESVSEVTSL